MKRTSRMTHMMEATLVALSLFLSKSAFAQYTETNADAVFNDVVHEYVLREDGSTTYTYEHHVTLLTSFAFNRAYGESFVVYNPAWQSLKVMTAETKMADGKTVKAPLNAFNEVLPGFAAGAAPYLGLKEMVVTHTGLESNATVHFAYRIDSKKGMLPGLTGKVLCGDRSPIRRLIVRVTIPVKDSLRFVFLRADARRTSSIDGPSKTYTWVLDSVPMMPVETMQPAMEQYLPMFLFTTATGMESVRHVLGDAATLLALDPKAKAVADEVVKDCATPAAKMIALRAWVESAVGQVNGDLLVLGFHPLPAQETFRRNVGSQLDRAILLAALCRAENVDATPVLGIAYDDIGFPLQNIHDDFFSCLLAFSLPGVWCKGLGADGGDLLLDPNAFQSGEQASRFAGKRCLKLADADVFPLVLVAPPPLSNVGIIFNGMIDPDGTVHGDVTMVAHGLPAMESDTARLVTVTRAAFAKYGQGMSASEAAVRELKPQRVACGATGLSKSALTSSDGLVKFALPQTPGGVADLHFLAAVVERLTPIEFPRAGREGNMVTLRLPQGWHCATLPPSVQKSTDAGEVICDVREENGIVTVKRSLNISHARIAAETYKQLRDLLDAWFDPAFSSLYLTKGK